MMQSPCIYERLRLKTTKRLSNDLRNTSDLRIILLGKTGQGKSAAGNTMLGRKMFHEDFSFTSVTSECQKNTTLINGRQITVIDTPGLFDTDYDNEDTKKEILRCITMAAPGPHVFLLVIAIGRYTQEGRDAVKMIQEMFGDEAGNYTIILFTRGDDLQGKTLKKYLDKAPHIKNLLRHCGDRYCVFNNREKNDKSQVHNLLHQIDVLLSVNGGKYYTADMFQKAEEALKQRQDKILKEREEEIRKEKEELQAKHEAAMKELKREMEEEKREQVEERRKREEEFRIKEQDMKNNMSKLEQAEKIKMEEHIKVLRLEFDLKLEKEANASKERERKNIEFQEKKYEDEKSRLKKETEQAARKQAEEEFHKELDRKVKEAFDEGKRKVESERTVVGRGVDCVGNTLVGIYAKVFQSLGKAQIGAGEICAGETIVEQEKRVEEVEGEREAELTFGDIA